MPRLNTGNWMRLICGTSRTEPSITAPGEAANFHGSRQEAANGGDVQVIFQDDHVDRASRRPVDDVQHSLRFLGTLVMLLFFTITVTARPASLVVRERTRRLAMRP
jgi:hypothetical protein